MLLEVEDYRVVPLLVRIAEPFRLEGTSQGLYSNLCLRQDSLQSQIMYLGVFIG